MSAHLKNMKDFLKELGRPASESDVSFYFLQIHTKPNFTATHASHNFSPEEQHMNVICHLLLAEECFTV